MSWINSRWLGTALGLIAVALGVVAVAATYARTGEVQPGPVLIALALACATVVSYSRRRA